MKKTILFVLCSVIIIFFFLTRATENNYSTLSAHSLETISPLSPKTAPRLGLALGGGGVRGFLHIGVLQALEEAHIRPDLLTGASAGSIVASLYASGMNTREIYTIADNIPRWKMADPVLSSQGAVQGQGIARWLNTILNNRPIEKMVIPVGIAITDLNKGEPLLITAGNTGEAVQTSCSIPGTFIPVRNKGNTWVDGAILSSVPIRFAKAMGADIVVGVDIYCGNIPQPGNTALSTVMLAFRHQSCQASKTELAEADFLIQPDFEPQNFASFSEKEKAIAAGYAAMKKVLPELHAALAIKNAE